MAIMAIIKGVFDLVTVLPDSSGWENCQKRLGEDGLTAFRGQFNFTSSFLLSLWNMLIVEVTGWKGGRLRYCADMMVSGHTYFAVLFSLSTFKMVRYTSKKRSHRWIKHLVAIVCAFCVVTEVILVA